MPAKSKKTPEEAAELAAMETALQQQQDAAKQLILETGWAKLEEAHQQARLAGRALLLFGVRALQLRNSLPYGVFGQQLALQCPEISKSAAYRAMQSLHAIGASLFPKWEKCGEVADANLASLAQALTGTGELWLAAQIDELIEGKTNRQLLLGIKEDKTATDPSKEEYYQEKCLHHFATHPELGAIHEAKWRWDAECGDITWAQCWQKIDGAQENPPAKDEPPDPKRLYRLLSSGILRITTWATQENWQALSASDREKLLPEWEASFSKLHPDLRFAAAQALKGGQS